jgi:chromate reductase
MNTESKERIRIVAVIGSVRPGNYTSRALNLVADEIRQRDDAAVEVIDPATMALPFPGEEDGGGDGQRLREAVSRATGVVFSTPEYHGGYSSVIKLVIENLGFPSVLAGKPLALLGVAAGQIGAIKSLESLRGICSHVGAIVLPGPVSVAGVQKLFDEESSCLDEAVERRIRGVATNLLDYIHDSICPRMALEAMVRSGAA